MSEQGVPSSVLVGEDHIQVRAALIALLKGANQAVVWTRIEYRARHVAYAHEQGGRQWWEVKAADLGREVGLTKSQVETAVANLVEKGFLLAEQHSLPMQTVSYSPVILQSGEIGIGAGPDRESPVSSSDISDLQIGDSGIPPLYQEREDVQEAPIVPVTDPVVVWFERVWSLWPTSRRGARKKAESSWRTAVKSFGARDVEALAKEAARFCIAWQTWAAPELQYVPYLTTWLNQARWTMPTPELNKGRKPGTVESGRVAADILRERRAAREQKQVAS